MSTLPHSLATMLSAWNERDLAAIRGHLDACLAPDVVFADPDNLIRGVEEFEAMVNTFREKIPNAVCAHTSGFNSHHNRYRYNWLVSSDGQALVAGMDVVELDANGRVARVDGFFGPVPEC